MTNALEEAARAGDLENARALVASGIDPNARNGSGSTALYGLDDANAVRILLAAGADPNLESTAESEGLPLCFAACWGDDAVVSVLLEGGADPTISEDHGEGSGPLTWAARGGHLNAAEALLKAGADPNAADEWHRAHRGVCGHRRHRLELRDGDRIRPYRRDAPCGVPSRFCDG